MNNNMNQILSQFEKIASIAMGEDYVDNQTRQKHERMLDSFNQIDSVPKLQFILKNSKNDYALYYVCKTLTKQFTENWNHFSFKDKTNLRMFLIAYLGKNGSNLRNFLVKEILKLVCRITKLGWLSDQENRDLPEQIKKYFVQNAHKNEKLTILGMNLLENLILEMSHFTDKKRSLGVQRKTSVSFRDLALRGIFETALFSLKEIIKSKKGFYSKDICDNALNLIMTCLRFDFIGIFPDESGDDISTIQIPDSWRPLFEESNTVEVLWKLYSSINHNNGQKKIMETLVYLSSVRRSLFTGEEERATYLKYIIDGIAQVLKEKKGLDNQNTLHELCRLLARLKSNFQLNEFVGLETYNNWIQLVANFTIQIFKTTNTEFYTCVYYLLTFWGRLISSKPYLRSNLESNLDKYVPEISKQFIQSRLTHSRKIVLEEESDPFDDEQMLFEFLDTIPSVLQSNYQTIGLFIKKIFDPILQKFEYLIQQLSNNNNNNQNSICRNIMAIEAQITWIIYMIGAVISKHYYSSTTKEVEKIDAELVILVVKSFRITGKRISFYNNNNNNNMDPDIEDQQKSSEHLEKSVLYFMKHVQKIYLIQGTFAKRSFFEKTKELFKINDQLGILDLFVQKCVHNLRNWPNSLEIVNKTVKLFSVFTRSYSTGKLMVKLESIKYLLNSHSPEHFSFMNVQNNLRQRTYFL